MIKVLDRKNIIDNFTLETLEVSGEKILAINSGTSYQSLCYANEDKVFDIYDPYPKLYDILSNLDGVTSVLTLGGGGFSYPKYYIKNYPNKTMDVVEINQILIDISMKYFYLDKLYEQYDPNYERLNIICDDAFSYIYKTNKKYNGIFVDLYNDANPLDGIYEESFIKRLKEISDTPSYLMVNYIYHESDKDKYLHFIDLIKNNFKYLKVITISNNVGKKDTNMLILCSDFSINIPDTFSYETIFSN